MLLLVIGWNVITFRQRSVCTQSAFCTQPAAVCMSLHFVKLSFKNISHMLQWCSQDFSKGGGSLTRMTCRFRHLLYTCQLSRITHESQTNFSCLKNQLNIYSNLFEKSFGNLSTPLVIFGSRQKIFGNLCKSSDDLSKLSEIFDNLRKPSVNLQKFRFCEDEKSHPFYWKKVGRYTVVGY